MYDRTGVRRRRPKWLLQFVLLATLVAAALGQLKEYRTADSTGNNIKKPKLGAEGARFYRTLPAHYQDGMNIPVPNVSPRLVSDRLFSRGPFAYNTHNVAFMTAAWGQFIAHDMILTQDTAEPWPIPATLCDPVYDPTCEGYNITFARLKYDPATGNALEPRVALNGQTAFIDASTVYGANDARSRLLRTFSGGELLEDPVDGCPTNPRGIEMAAPGRAAPLTRQRLTGDVRGNVNPGILAIHCAFVLEHNYWARRLGKANPGWGDETLYQEARARVIAEVQAITYSEYLPTILGEAYAQIPPYAGYKSDVDASADIFFATGAYRYGHSGINSLYLRLAPDGGMIPAGNVLLRTAFFNPAYMGDGGIAALLRGLVAQPESAIDTAMVDDVRQFLFGIRADLAAIDIQRGRDCGLPRYKRARQYFGLPVPATFAEVTDDVQVQQALADVYGTLDAVDAWVGGLAERPLAGGMVGPLFAASIVEQAVRSRDGDRFWFESYLPADVAAEVRSTTFADVLARAVPGIGPGGLPRSVFRVPASGVYCFTGACPRSSSSSSSSSTAAAPSATIPPSAGTGVIANGTGGATSAAPAAAAPAYLTKDVSESLSMKYWPIETNQAQIEFVLKGKGWVGLGLGTGMVGADMTICRFPDPTQATGTCEDYSSTGYVQPTKKGTQTSEMVSSARDATTTTYRFKRLVATSDAAGKSISTSGATNVVIAWSVDSDTLAYHGPNRFIGSVDFTAPKAASGSPAGGSTTTGTGTGSTAGTTTAGGTTAGATAGSTTTAAAVTGSSTRTYTGVHIMHGAAMFTVWGALVPAGVFTVRYMKHSRFWLNFHKGGMALAATLTFSAAGSVLSIGQQAPQHFALGVAVASVLVLQVVFGVATAYFHTSERKWGLRAVLRRVHPVMGHVLVGLALANVCIGLQFFGNLFWLIGVGWICLLAVVFAVFEARHRLEQRRSAASKYTIAELMPKKLTTLTVDEIDRNLKLGAKWVMLGPYVYDVAEFLHTHPGGANFLLRTIGRDIGYYFSGAEALEGDSPHAHSRKAHEMLARLAIGVIEKNAAAAGNDLLDGVSFRKKASLASTASEAPEGAPPPRRGRHRRDKGEGEAPASPWSEGSAPDFEEGEGAASRGGRRRELPPIKIRGRRQVAPGPDDGAGGADGRARRNASGARRAPRIGSPQGAPASPPAQQPVSASSSSAGSRASGPKGGAGDDPLVVNLTAVGPPAAARSSPPAGPVATYTLIERELVTRGVRPIARLRFRSPRPVPSAKRDVRLFGEYYELFASVDGHELSRYYSVCQVNVEDDDADAEHVVDLYVRRYPQGRVSTLLHTMSVGQTCRMAGPIGLGLRLTPESRGNLVAVTAGTGVVPFLDLVYHLTFSPAASVTLLLVACFESAGDILLHEWLEACHAHAAASPERRLELHIALRTAPDARWGLEKHHITGRVTPAVLDGLLPVGGPESFYICGSSKFAAEMGRAVAQLKISPQRVVIL